MRRSPSVSRPAHRGATVTRKPPLPSARARWRIERVRSAGSFPAGASAAHAPPPAPHPPSLPRPGPSVLSQHRTRRCLVLLGQPWCILAARGSSHGDGSSERAVRAAGESGDGHDGPQLHPALSAGSPKGSWALAPRACPETLPQPKRPCAAHNPDPLQPTRPLDLPPHPQGAFPSSPSAPPPTPSFSSRHACPFPGTLGP